MSIAGETCERFSHVGGGESDFVRACGQSCGDHWLCRTGRIYEKRSTALCLRRQTLRGCGNNEPSGTARPWPCIKQHSRSENPTRSFCRQTFSLLPTASNSTLPPSLNEQSRDNSN
jgi:hypothetical protein